MPDPTNDASEQQETIEKQINENTEVNDLEIDMSAKQEAEFAIIDSPSNEILFRDELENTSMAELLDYPELENKTLIINTNSDIPNEKFISYCDDLLNQNVNEIRVLHDGKSYSIKPSEISDPDIKESLLDQYCKVKDSETTNNKESTFSDFLEQIQKSSSSGYKIEIKELSDTTDNTEIKEKIENIEKNIEALNHEKLIVIDSEGNAIHVKDGTRNSVELDEIDKEKMHNNIITHNHPPEIDGTYVPYASCSFEKGYWNGDIPVACENEVKELRVVTEQGTMVIQPKDSEYFSSDSLEDVAKEYEELLNTSWTEAANELSDKADEFIKQKTIAGEHIDFNDLADYDRIINNPANSERIAEIMERKSQQSNFLKIHYIPKKT